MTLQDYTRLTWPELTRERPQLLEVATAIGEWWGNGRTGDVLNVSMPTRFGKSLLATCLTAWLLISDPHCRVMRASYAADLAESFSLQVRAQYLAFFERFGAAAPAITGTRARWMIGANTQASHIAVGINGGVTGFGCDIAIIDDTAKNMLEATSAAYSRTLASFRDSVLLGRLEGRRKVLNVGTRWTVNDWFSMWPDAGEYILPAMIDGRSVCEAWKTTAELELERSRVSGEVWDAQYMQRPTATGRVRLFEGWRPAWSGEIPDAPRVVVIDPATDYGSDYFVAGEYVCHGGMVYLCDMFAEQAATIEQVAQWLCGRQYRVGWVECNGAGAHIMDRLRRLGVRNLAGFSTTADKYSRAYVQSEAVKHYLRISNNCNLRAVEELARQADAFPIGGDNIHDDLIDNVIMAFERLYRI